MPLPSTHPLGDRLQRVIHAGLDAVPMPAKVRTAIKQCGGCARRREFLNRVGAKVRAELPPARSP